MIGREDDKGRMGMEEKDDMKTDDEKSNGRNKGWTVGDDARRKRRCSEVEEEGQMCA